MPRPDTRIMDHNNNHNQHNGSGSGFLLGVVVGVLITLLFTTKRGRAIFKEILEKGIDKFSNLEDLMKKSYEEDIDDEFEDEDDYIPAEPVTIPEVMKETREPEKKVAEEKPVSKPVKPPETPKSEKGEQASAPTLAVEEKSVVQEKKEEEKPKATQGKRWFRGLRKKS